MSNILRSIVPSPSSGDNEKLMYQNFITLRESVLRFDMPSDVNIYEYIKDFSQKHGHLPNAKSIRDYFEQNQSFDEADRIQQISTQSVAYRGDFISLIEKSVEEGRLTNLASMLADAKMIAKSGLEIKEGKTKRTLKGARDASNHLLNQISKINTPTFGSRIGGEALSDGDDFWDAYEKAKNSELDIRPMTGLSVIDNAIGGFKKKELYILAAFTGHLKSTSSLNWVYNQAIYGGTNTIYFSLEMHYPQCRRIIYTYHSMHPKFRKKRIALGLQTGQTDVCIDPKKIKEGTLTKDEEAFMKEVVKDLNDGVKSGQYGSLRFEVADPNLMDFTVEDLRARAEAIAQSESVKMIVVDHALLVSPRRWVASTTDRLNEVIRDLKKTALGFNRGEGIPILCLFQISREGFKSAEKNGGSYNLTHLSYANEAERSADVVISSWFGEDMKQNSQVKYQCLKSRDQAPFDNFEAQISWPAGRVLDMPLQFQSSTAKSKPAPKGDALDKILDEEL
jgi:replicative DNA helicase